MIGSCTSFVDSQAAADLMQESRLKLATLIGVELFRGRKTEKKNGYQLVGNCCRLLVWYSIGLRPTCKVVHCHQNVTIS